MQICNFPLITFLRYTRSCDFAQNFASFIFISKFSSFYIGNYPAFQYVTCMCIQKILFPIDFPILKNFTVKSVHRCFRTNYRSSKYTCEGKLIILIIWLILGVSNDDDKENIFLKRQTGWEWKIKVDKSFLKHRRKVIYYWNDVVWECHKMCTKLRDNLFLKIIFINSH